MSLTIFLNLLNNFRVGKRHDVADITVVGYGTKYPPHDLAGAGFRHIGHDPDLPTFGNLADLEGNGIIDFLGNLGDALNPGFRATYSIRLFSFDFMGNRNNGSLCNLRNRQGSRFDLFGSKSMAGDVDNIVDPAQDTEIAVCCFHGRITGQIRPITPIFAVRVLVVSSIVVFDKTLHDHPRWS